jgi:hypothetical protein
MQFINTWLPLACVLAIAMLWIAHGAQWHYAAVSVLGLIGWGEYLAIRSKYIALLVGLGLVR